MLLIIEGHESHLNLIATTIFLLNGIDVLVLPAHSSHLFQMFDIAVGVPLKTAFKQELDRRTPTFARKAGGNRDNAQRLQTVLVKSFLNVLRKSTTLGDILAGFEATGMVPFDPEVLLSSQFAVDIVDPAILHVVRTGAEVNEIVRTFPEGLDFLCRHEFGRAMQEANHDMSYRRNWDHLKTTSVDDGRVLSNPPSMFVRIDGSVIRRVSLHELPA
jgi:hypothetical protein